MPTPLGKSNYIPKKRREMIPSTETNLSHQKHFSLTSEHTNQLLGSFRNHSASESSSSSYSLTFTSISSTNGLSNKKSDGSRDQPPQRGGAVPFPALGRVEMACRFPEGLILGRFSLGQLYSFFIPVQCAVTCGQHS